MKVKRKDLEIFLQQLESFSQPKIQYEQYPTPSRVAANVLWFAALDNNDIYNRTVLDLGCGTGILAIGAASLGGKAVYGIDIDIDSLKIAKENAQEYSFDSSCYWVCADIRELELKKIDTTIMNPPFGMRKESITRDREFLLKALEVSSVIYSINPHAQKTRVFFEKFCKEHNAEVTNIIKMDFDLSREYDFHAKKRHVFQVDLYRIINHNF